MRTNADKTFTELIADLTPLQLDWIRWRIDSRSDREASRRIDVDKSTPGRWKADGVPLDDIVKAAKQDGLELLRERIRRDINRAYDVKRAGLDSRHENVRQGVATEILDRGLGKATQHQETKADVSGDIRIVLGGNILADEL